MSDHNQPEMLENIDPEIQVDKSIQWYAVYCKSRHEKKVAEQLEEKSIEHYLPLKTEVRQWSDRKKKVELPLFKSYIFVHINPSMQMPVLETYGAVTFVKFGGKLVPIQDEQIEAVRRIESYGVGLRSENADFQLDDHVKITGGPCAGLTGYLSHRKKNRFIVVVDSIQLGASVEIQSEWLEKIDEDPD